MKRYILISICLILVFISFLTYFLYLKNIDTKYARMYSQVFGSYDIRQVDEYLDEATVITYNNISKPYKQLRENVIVAFEEKKFKMLEGSSYGSGNNKFINGVQEVNIYSYVYYENKSFEVPIVMQLEIKGINKFKVRSLSSNAEFFGYLFFKTTIKRSSYKNRVRN